MSRRLNTGRRVDAAIVGGGVVGAACALALSQQGLQVTLIEDAEPPAWQSSDADPRVYAFAPDNAALFESLGVWTAVRDARAHPYRRMRVWDAAGGDELRFDADAFAVKQLGWIIEHALLQDRLWTALRQSNVVVRCPARVVALEKENDDASNQSASNDSVTLELDDGLRIEARIAIAADGGRSTLRELAGIGMKTEDYGQRGVVAYVATERSHEDTAWQRFLPTGPLAFLPCAPWPDAANVSSIVWTLPDAEAARVIALDDMAFAEAITGALASRLGDVRPLTQRIAYLEEGDRVVITRDGAEIFDADDQPVTRPITLSGITGALIVEASAKQSGRTITLAGISCACARCPGTSNSSRASAE